MIDREAIGIGASEGGRLAELYATHANDAARLAFLLTGDRALAEDLTHEAFVRLAARFRDLRSPEAFPWYLRRTIVNLARSHFRHARVERQYLAARATERAPTSDAPDAAEHDELWRALQRLPEMQRAAIVLRFYEDLSESQTAEILGCPVGTVKSHVSRGMERLRGLVTRDA